MFSKETDKPETFIGSSIGSKEELKVRGTLRINGTVKGQLDADRVILRDRLRERRD
jgi:cytoskeletal protein CcmA (bactofilin family)